MTIVGTPATAGDEDDIRDRIALMCCADQDPELASGDLDFLLTVARRPDTDDNVYGDSDWTATYDVSAAAAEGWRLKAGRAAARFNFAEDGQNFDRAQIYAQCLSQAEQFARRSMGSIPVTPT